MRHGEDAIPGGGRLVEEIVLAAFPIHARRAVVGPTIEDGLEGVLGLGPLALEVEVAGLGESLQSATCNSAKAAILLQFGKFAH